MRCRVVTTPQARPHAPDSGGATTHEVTNQPPPLQGHDLYGTDAAGNARTPNSTGYIVELDYLPIQNVRLMFQYTGYNKFDGAKNNYDGNGRNASDNNTAFFNVWVAF